MVKNMKLLVICGYSPNSILDYNEYLLTEVEYISSIQGNKVSLITPKGNKKFNENFNHLPMGFFSTNKLNSFKSSLGQLSMFLEMHSKIGKISPDIILCHGGGIFNGIFFIGLFLSKLFKSPLILEWVGSDLLENNLIFKNKLKDVIISNCDNHIVRNREMKSILLSSNKDANVRILPALGINTEVFSPNEEVSDIKDKKTRVLFVGRLNKVKGIKYLIKAFSKLEKKYEDIRLIIVGDGKLKKQLIKITEKKSIEDKVIFTGTIKHDDLPFIYSKADIFVLPSISEGLSNVIMEAMACGLPVIATNVGGNPELVRDKKGGFLVTPKNSKEISRAIEKLIEKPQLRKSMGKFNREYVKKYDQNNILKNKLEMFEKIVES